MMADSLARSLQMNTGLWPMTGAIQQNFLTWPITVLLWPKWLSAFECSEGHNLLHFTFLRTAVQQSSLMIKRQSSSTVPTVKLLAALVSWLVGKAVTDIQLFILTDLTGVTAISVAVSHYLYHILHDAHLYQRHSHAVLGIFYNSSQIHIVIGANMDSEFVVIAGDVGTI